ncbi:MAG: ACP S-malonyltransferase [Deltaproteobacteria bacterium]|nr:ACP S-malonyltransferase [Deltaproteobacteria bacterium]
MEQIHMAAVGAVFPGQGSQEPNMGRDLAEFWDEAMDLWKRAEKASGLPLREVYWEAEHPLMADTRYLQPALTVVNVGLWAWAAKGLRVAAMAGHSLGEYSALFAAGVLGLDETLSAVSLRGRLMAEAGSRAPGAMAAVLRLDEEAVREVVDEVRAAMPGELRIANFNTPAQFVLSGSVDSVRRACELCSGRKGRAVPLPVSGAFHSPLMAEASNELARHLDRLTWRDAEVDVFFNATARPERTSERIKALMRNQMVESVRWTGLIQAMHNNGVGLFLEFGPKGVLTRMAGQILKNAEQSFEARQVSNMAEVSVLRNQIMAAVDES